jgi:hypothetical protein
MNIGLLTMSISRQNGSVPWAVRSLALSPALRRNVSCRKDSWEKAVDMSPETASIAVALEQLLEMTELKRRTMGDKGRRFVEERFTWPAVAGSMRSVYSWVLGRGPMPACVVSK